MRMTSLFLLALVAVGFAGEYHVNKDAANQVKFISDAPIEDFEGVTSKIDGYLYWEGDNPTSNSALYFEVDLNSLDTGIGLRNRHMRENYLQTDKYPLTHFTGKITNATKDSSGNYEVAAQGQLFIHGVERPLTVNAKLQPVENSSLRVTCTFIVALSDFEIEVPSLMFYKIDENMDLVLDFTLLPATGEK
jgi:polyisoprenoid-binding protein YceI